MTFEIKYSNCTFEGWFKTPMLYPNRNEEPNMMVRQWNNRLGVKPCTKQRSRLGVEWEGSVRSYYTSSLDLDPPAGERAWGRHGTPREERAWTEHCGRLNVSIADPGPRWCCVARSKLPGGYQPHPHQQSANVATPMTCTTSSLWPGLMVFSAHRPVTTENCRHHYNFYKRINWTRTGPDIAPCTPTYN